MTCLRNNSVGKRAAACLIVLLVALGIWILPRGLRSGVLLRSSEPNTAAAVPQSAALAVVEENHYSPGENLERLDLAHIQSARRSLDIAMYAFTDRYLAEAIVRAARSGVRVRLYRDREQFEDEQRQTAGRRSPSTTEILLANSNIEIRVKSSRELMHLKAYCVDGVLLRDGSANWSTSGLKRQDNNARYTTNSSQVQQFQQLFEELWAGNNAKVSF